MTGTAGHLFHKGVNDCRDCFNHLTHVLLRKWRHTRLKVWRLTFRISTVSLDCLWTWFMINSVRLSPIIWNSKVRSEAWSPGNTIFWLTAARLMCEDFWPQPFLHLTLQKISSSSQNLALRNQIVQVFITLRNIFSREYWSLSDKRCCIIQAALRNHLRPDADFCNLSARVQS